VNIFKQGIVAGEEKADLVEMVLQWRKVPPQSTAMVVSVESVWMDMTMSSSYLQALYFDLIDVQNDCSGCLLIVEHTNIHRTSNPFFFYFAFIVHQ
jgi:hypothetical protein